MKVLITGGAGFIGGNFVHYFLREHPEDTLICVDKLTYAGNMETLAGAAGHPSFSFIKADIADAQAIEGIFAEHRPQRVVNFAAETHVDRSIDEPSVFLVTNIIGTQVLLDACRRHDVEKLVQVSTDEVYGDLPLDRPDLAFSEDSPLRPSSPYAASKTAADLLCLAYARTYGATVNITRCSNNYGPYQFPEKLIPLMVANAMQDKPLPVYGTGMNIRDWLHVDDHCRAIDLVMRDGRPGEVYNIGGNNERANIDVVKTILSLLEKPESLITFVTDRPGHDLRYAIDAGKIDRELGWQPQVPFEEGLADTIRWYQENRGWWQRILSGEYREA